MAEDKEKKGGLNAKFEIKEINDLRRELENSGDLFVGRLSQGKKIIQEAAATSKDMFKQTNLDVGQLVENSTRLQALVEDAKSAATVATDAIKQMNKDFDELTDRRGNNLKEKYGATTESLIEAARVQKLLNKLKKEQQKIEANIQAQISGITDPNDRDAEYAKLKLQHAKEEEAIQTKILDLREQMNNFGLAKPQIAAEDVRNIEKIANEHLPKIKDALEESNTRVQTLRDEINETARATEEAKKKSEEWWGTVKAVTSAVWRTAKIGIDKWAEINQAITDFGRRGGMSAAQIKAMQGNVLQTYDQLAAQLGMTFEEIFQFQDKYIKSTGRAIQLTTMQVESMASMSKLVGPDAVSQMAENMDSFGMSASDATDYLALNMARARAQGLDAAKASEALANNVKMAAKYTFKEGVDGISKMTLMSQRLKFNMESIGSTIEKFSTIEGAIETSANVQVLGGAYAAQFANPLQAMGEALLDAEGFTQRIVDTVASQASFNRQTGQVEMAAFEKARLREFAKQMGMDYSDVWNMATQQAKIHSIGNEMNHLTEEDKALVANKAQFNTEKNQWQVVLADGTERAVKELQGSDLQQLRDIQVPQEAIRKDVREIRDTLRDYVGFTARDTRSGKELWKGTTEGVKIAGADMMDPALQWGLDTGRNATSDISSMQLNGLAIGSVALAGVGAWLGTLAGKNLLDSKILPYYQTQGSLSNYTPRTWGQKQALAKRTMQGRGLINKVVGGGKYAHASLGRGITSTAGKALGVVGGVAEMGYGAYTLTQLSKQKKQIEADTSLSARDKELQKSALKKQNTGTWMQTIGGALTAAAPFLGPAAPFLLATGLGLSIAGGIKSSNGKRDLTVAQLGANNEPAQGAKTDEVMKTIGENQLTTLQSIDTTLGEINDKGGVKSYAVSNVKNSDIAQTSSTVLAVNNNTQSNITAKEVQGDKSTRIVPVFANAYAMQTSTMNIAPMDININGSIKLVGENGVSYPMNLLDNVEFRQQIITMVKTTVNEELAGGLGRTNPYGDNNYGQGKGNDQTISC